MIMMYLANVSLVLRCTRIDSQHSFFFTNRFPLHVRQTTKQYRATLNFDFLNRTNFTNQYKMFNSYIFYVNVSHLNIFSSKIYPNGCFFKSFFIIVGITFATVAWPGSGPSAGSSLPCPERRGRR